MLASLDGAATSPHGEAEVRRQLDLAIGRALVEPRFAALLLADPTVALGAAGGNPQQQLQLRGIRAGTVEDFARQAELLFWPARQSSVGASTGLSQVVAL